MQNLCVDLSVFPKSKINRYGKMHVLTHRIKAAEFPRKALNISQLRNMN